MQTGHRPLIALLEAAPTTALKPFHDTGRLEKVGLHNSWVQTGCFDIWEGLRQFFIEKNCKHSVSQFRIAVNIPLSPTLTAIKVIRHIFGRLEMGTRRYIQYSCLLRLGKESKQEIGQIEMSQIVRKICHFSPFLSYLPLFLDQPSIVNQDVNMAKLLFDEVCELFN